MSNSIRCRSRGRARNARRHRHHFRRARSAARAVPLRAGPASDAARRHRRRGRAPLLLDLLRGAGRRAAHRGQEEPGRRVLDLGQRGAEGGRHDRRHAAARPLQRAARREQRAHYLGFAAGSGITPLLSIVKTTLAGGAAEPLHARLRQSRVGHRDVQGRARGAQGHAISIASTSSTCCRARRRTSSSCTAASTAPRPMRCSRTGCRWPTSTPRSSAGRKA